MGNEKTLVASIPVDLHAEVKARAALRNISMTTYVIRILYDAIREAKRYEDEK